MITKTGHLLAEQRALIDDLAHASTEEAWRTIISRLLDVTSIMDQALSRGADLPAPWDTWRPWNCPPKRRRRGLTNVTRRPNPGGMSAEQWYVTCRLCSYDDHCFTVGTTMESGILRALMHLAHKHGIGSGDPRGVYGGAES